ncbi:hypothetical protein [Nitrosomonas marina]|uniref:Uncharacterized protein n=1 Tax=Nitrosomonas marina TaxID=917 RepID=A0A1H8J5B7_9PROT|nr:hypothetical protein [Nitrosomonas marina]SEN75407.1 hypothetical protein SAMN05216325_1532 [Nitrosomonas marina]
MTQIALDYVSGPEKLKLVKELGTIRRHLPTVAGVNKLTLVKRIREIRRLLSIGIGTDPVGLTIDPGDIDATYKSFVDYLENGIEQVPEPLRRFDKDAIVSAWYVFDSNLNRSEKLSDHTELVSKKYFQSTQGDVFDHFKSLGNVFEYDSGKLKTIADELNEIAASTPADPPEIAEKKKNISQVNTELVEKLNKLMDQRLVAKRSGDLDSFNETNELFNSLHEKYLELREEYKLLDKVKYENKKARIEELKNQIAPVGEGFINTLIGASKVTREQADTWANAQVITKSAINRLKRIGYKEADIRRDMAEFYRITGGKLRQIIIDNDGSKRANARGIGSVENTAIYPDSRFDKKVLWHEMAHHLEADPIAKAASNGFLQKRRADEKVYSLRSLTGNRGYRQSEGAYKDDFISPYIGKVYRDNTTEVWAMGIQYLSNPQDAALMLGKDPEMAALIAGYLQSDLTPGTKILQAAQNLAKDKIQAKRSYQDAQYENAIKKLSDGVEIIDDGWFDALPEIDKDMLLSYSFRRNSSAEFIGSWNGFRVFKGKFRSRKTRRVSKGYEIIYAPESSFLDDDGRSRVPHGGTFHEEMDAIKAALRIAREALSNDIYRVSYKAFANYAHKSEIIDYANQIFGGES